MSQPVCKHLQLEVEGAVLKVGLSENRCTTLSTLR